MEKYLPEGKITKNNVMSDSFQTADQLVAAHARGDILQSRVLLCTAAHDLIVEMPFGAEGIIPRSEGDLSIGSDASKDIALLTRVGKEVCFKITDITERGGRTVYILSRRQAQEECMTNYISHLRSGDIIPVRVSHLEQFGAFVDIGCGISSLIPIDTISVSRISHPSDRFEKGQDAFAVVKAIEGGRVYLSHKELLGTWQENADNFAVGETVTGIVRSVESYGIFVELAPNLAGLAELKDDVYPGQSASVYIKAMIPDKMKVKLIIVDSFSGTGGRMPFDYYISSGRLERWVYSTEGSGKSIVSEFI